VVLDGSLSADVDGDLLEFQWRSNGRENLLATGAVASVLLPVGVHPIDLSVSDGSFKATNSIVIEVIPATDAVERLILLLASQPMDRPLVRALSAAMASIERGNPTAAINQLRTFQKQVRAQVSRVDPVRADRLIAEAQAIIDVLARARSAPVQTGHRLVIPSRSTPARRSETTSRQPVAGDHLA
jgi:hypothetical protein